MRLARHAFTLIEVLVVIAIVVLLVAIMIPAVNMARQTAKRYECANHLRQIGLALHNYAKSLRVFPFGGGGCVARNPGKRCEDWPVWSSLAMLLPYLDQRAVYNAINFDWATFGAPTDYCWLANSTAVARPLEVFLCPSDPMPAIARHRRPDPEGDQAGLCNYAACAGVDVHWLGTSGMFHKLSSTKPGDVSDGLSNTVAFSEILRGDSDRTSLSIRDTIMLQSWPVPGTSTDMNVWTPDNHVPNNPDVLERYVEQCDRAAPNSPAGNYNFSAGGMLWSWGGMGHTMFNTVLTPNSPHYDCSRNCFDCNAEWDGIHTARSLHPAGVNVLMADGSVRFISNNIDQRVWWALGTKAGGEKVEQGAF